jgi:phage repressor protein C with HTH and peptisase S24 domain
MIGEPVLGPVQANAQRPDVDLLHHHINVHNAHLYVKAKRTLLPGQNARMAEVRPDDAQRLQLAREKRGFAKAKEAADYFGWNYDTYIQHERGERGISRAVKRYAEAFKVSPGWLLTGEGKGPSSDTAPASASSGYRVEPNAAFEGEVRLPLKGPRDIEELGITVGGMGDDDSAFAFNGQVIDIVPRPPGIANRKGVFALRVGNTSMTPKFEDGERVYVEPRKPAIGDYVVIELKATEEGQPGKSFIKRLVTMNSARIEVEQFNPKGRIEFARDEVHQILRVIPVSELLGV